MPAARKNAKPRISYRSDHFINIFCISNAPVQKNAAEGEDVRD